MHHQQPGHPMTSPYRAILFAAVLLAFSSACDRRQEPVPAPIQVETPKSVPAEDPVYGIIRSGDSTAFEQWLAGNPNINQRGNNQTTPLIQASVFGRPVFVRQLLEHGADFNMVDLNGQTALHAAAGAGRAEIVRMLIEAGVESSITDYDGLTAYDVAMLSGQRQAAEVIADARAIKDSGTTGDATTSLQEIPPAVLLSTDFRTWTSASGDKIDAAFIQNVFDTVILQKRDGEMVRIGINRLCAGDQVVARQLSGIDPHALARARPERTSMRQRAPDSLADRFGGKSGWTSLTGCRLLKNSSNDGDSFHVSHEGKEYIFRLYFVDAAETRNDFPERIRDQARYFNLDEKATLRLGNEAARFTTSLLAGSAFNVYTKWEDARGNSSLPRHYALVSTPMGDLDELLTQEGLVRQFGMTIDGADGDRKHSRLRKLEQEAKNNKAGAWAKRDDVASGP